MPDAETAPRDLAERPRIGQTTWWFGLGATLLIAMALSLIAYAEGLPELFERYDFLDKVLHFGLAGTLAFFLDGVLKRRMVAMGPRGIIGVPVAALLLLVPLAFEEYLQRYSVNRTSSFGDFAADATGVAMMIWLSRRL